MSLSSLLVGRNLPGKEEAFPRREYMDYAGRACVSGMGLAALSVVATAFYLASQQMALMLLLPVLWLVILATIILSVVAHCRRLRVLGFGRGFIVAYVLDCILTRLFFMGTTIYLSFKKSLDEKQNPQPLTWYGIVWFILNLLNAVAMLVSLLAASSFIVMAIYHHVHP